MPETMSKRDRIQATIAREPTDRPPVSFWRHFYKQELTPEGLAAAMIDWQRTYDFDFVKVNARASYHVEDWGNRYLRSGNDQDPPRLDWYRVKEPSEWAQLDRLKPTEGVLGDHLKAIELIRQGLGPDVPILMTVFTPLSIAGNLAGTVQLMRQHLENHETETLAAIDQVADVFSAFAVECLNAGADGLFFATTKWATTDSISLEQYQRWGRPCDLRVLQAVEAAFNLLHVCGSNNMLTSLLDYPVQVLNWDATDPTNPNLADVLGRTEKAVMGGVTQSRTGDDGEREALLAEVAAAREATGGTGWLLGAGCVVPPQATDENLRALRQAAAG